MIDLSIVTITYRDPIGFAKTLESLRPLAESPIRFEHIVVDESEAENEGAIKSLPPNWPLVRIQSGRPLGIYGSMNSALEIVKGRYVWFLHGGDSLFSRTALENALKQLEKVDEPVVFCGSARLIRDGRLTYVRRPARSWLSSLAGGNTLCQQSMIYKRDVFERIGRFSERLSIAADYEHNWLCYFSRVRLVTCRQPLVDYDMSGASSRWSAAMDQFEIVYSQFRNQLSWMQRLRVDIAFLFERARLRLFNFLKSTRHARFFALLWYRSRRLLQ